MARSARTPKPPASGLGPTTRRLRSQTKDASPLRAGLSPPKRTTRQTRSRKSAPTAPSEPSPPTTAESENNTEAENTETEAESVEAEADAEINTTAPNDTQTPASQSEEEQSEGETPRSKAQLQSSSSHNASTGTQLPSSEANNATAQTTVRFTVQTTASISPQHAETTAAPVLESIAVQTTPGLVRGQAPSEAFTLLSPRTRNPGISFLHNIDSSPLDPGNSPAQQERDPKTLEFAYPITELYKLTRMQLIEVIRYEREARMIERSTFANDRSHLTRLETENRALKLSMHKKRARFSDDEEGEDSTSERPAVRRRLNPRPQNSSQRRQSPLARSTPNRRDPHITRLLFGSTFPLGPESTSDDEDGAQPPKIEDTPKAQGAHLFPDTGSTKYIIGNAERFETNEVDNKENDAEAATVDASQISSESSMATPTEQPPETPTTNRWGVRSFLGSVSRYIPGLRGATPSQNQVPDSSTPSASQSSAQSKPSQSQQAKGDDRSSTPSTQLEQVQQNRAQPVANSEEKDNQKTPSAQESARRQMPQTEPAKRQSQLRASGPATDRRKTVRQQRRNADAQYAAVKAKQQERAEHKARTEQQAHEAEEAKHANEEAENGQQVGQKRKRVRIDDMKVIPAGPPGTYGMMDKYFEQGSDSEDEYLELDEASTNKQEERRPAKRVRTEEHASTKGSSPPPSSMITKTPTPAPRQIAGDTRRAQVYAGRLFAESPDGRTYQGGNAFKQLTGEKAAASPASPNHQFNTPRRLETPHRSVTPRRLDTPRSANFNWAGHFAVPESSDSDSGEEQDGMQIDSPVGDEKTDRKESTTKPSAVSSAADDFLTVLKNDQARKHREKDEREKHEAAKKPTSSFTSPAATNIFASSAQKKNDTVIPGPETTTLNIPSVTPSASTSTFVAPTTVSPSPSPQKQAAPISPAWNHQMPPRPTPSHASLPAVTALNTGQATSAPAYVDSEALARARSAAEKYKPKVPSRLQASSRLSTSTVGSDVRENADDVAGADLGTSVESSIDNAKQIDNRKSQPAFGLGSEAASFMKPAPAKDIEAAASPSLKAAQAAVGTNATGSADGLNSEAAFIKAAPAQATEGGRSTISPTPFTSGISLPRLVVDDAEVQAVIGAIPEDGLLANFEYDFPKPEDIEMDDVVREAVEEMCQGDEWERAAVEEFERGYKEWYEEMVRQGMVVDGSVIVGDGNESEFEQAAQEVSRSEGALHAAEVVAA